ncbi:T9SS type A sorting domain-containing protein, partial [Escherichia coli]|uniref:T9SS type A sorting domain-containing protein n=1 Tax=Escherichia coli TaxID=562 RepID=UPI002158689D
NNAVKNVLTGMRVILNNNAGPNSPSDDACGAYTSGETEDYVVTFRAGVLGVGSNAGIISNASVYPNPTDGRFALDISSTKSLGTVKVTVSSLTGQTILMNEYEAGSATTFQAALNLSGQARGMYLVTIDAAGDRSLRKIVLE